MDPSMFLVYWQNVLSSLDSLVYILDIREFLSTLHSFIDLYYVSMLYWKLRHLSVLVRGV